jgi:hypothetical protein
MRSRIKDSRFFGFSVCRPPNMHSKPPPLYCSNRCLRFIFVHNPTILLFLVFAILLVAFSRGLDLPRRFLHDDTGMYTGSCSCARPTVCLSHVFRATFSPSSRRASPTGPASLVTLPALSTGHDRILGMIGFCTCIENRFLCTDGGFVSSLMNLSSIVDSPSKRSTRRATPTWAAFSTTARALCLRVRE